MAAETVVFLHSSGATPRQWSAAGAIAARLGLRATAPALVGHDSEAPWAAGVRPTLAGEVERLCARLPKDGGIHLVGHSYGAAVALKAALSGRLDVRSVAIYEPSLFALLGSHINAYPAAESPLVAGREITLLFAAGHPEESARTYVDYWSSPGEFDRMPGDRRARVVERMATVVDCFSALFRDPTQPADLNELAVPCLVMAGERSPQPSQDIAEVIAGSIPEARLHRFSTLNHMGPIAEPAAVNAVIDEFLQEVTGFGRPAMERRAA